LISTPDFYNELVEVGFETFYGVPDSLLKDICAYISDKTSSEKHIITANEGNAIALASGYHLATKKTAVVYLQNSGLGNTINPLLSLTDEAVYKIPILLIIGWRGEPGIQDEPQHFKQGAITESLLNVLGIRYQILTDDYRTQLKTLKEWLNLESKPVALLVKKGAFTEYSLSETKNLFSLLREDVLSKIISNIGEDAIVVSTTGKTSREIYEIREINKQSHENDFLTVGSMGHTSSIALGLALNADRNVYCIDGDGSMLMHLGGLGIVAQKAPKNFKYILINNGAHESVGAQPTIAHDIKLKKLLESLGFNNVYEVTNEKELESDFKSLKAIEKSALIVNVKIGSRDDLGRPKQSPQENKKALMNLISKDRS
jgi:phosphonopyruvate decarboxylase